MGNKKIIFLTLAGLLTAALFFVALRGNPDSTGIRTTQQPIVQIPKRTVEKIADLSFSPSEIAAKPSQTFTANIIVNTNGKPITGVQTDLSFDPSMLTNFQILPPLDSESFFGKQGEYFILFTDVDRKIGRASYAIAISPGAAPKFGSGIVGRISFSISSSRALPSTKITFTGDTMVTKENETESVLKNTLPLTVLFSL